MIATAPTVQQRIKYTAILSAIWLIDMIMMAPGKFSITSDGKFIIKASGGLDVCENCCDDAGPSLCYTFSTCCANVVYLESTNLGDLTFPSIVYEFRGMCGKLAVLQVTEELCDTYAIDNDITYIDVDKSEFTVVDDCLDDACIGCCEHCTDVKMDETMTITFSGVEDNDDQYDFERDCYDCAGGCNNDCCTPLGESDCVLCDPAGCTPGVDCCDDLLGGCQPAPDIGSSSCGTTIIATWIGTHIVDFNTAFVVNADDPLVTVTTNCGAVTLRVLEDIFEQCGAGDFAWRDNPTIFRDVFANFGDATFLGGGSYDSEIPTLFLGGASYTYEVTNNFLLGSECDDPPNASDYNYEFGSGGIGTCTWTVSSCEDGSSTGQFP